MSPKPQLFSIDQFFRALSDPTRLRILNLIGDREVCVCYFVQILGVSQPKISRHLAYLRRQQLVTARRQGKWMHYRLAPPSDPIAANILRETLLHLAEKHELAEDLAKLRSACCEPRIFLLPDAAPPPAPVHSAKN